MAFTFQEVWLHRVKEKLSTVDNAPWLDGIPELDVEVLETGANGPSEKNSIHVPLEIFDVDILVNNNSYPIAIQDYTDDEAVISLDKYQTKVIRVSDDQINGATYDKVDSAIRAGNRGILEEKFKRAIHSLAPLVENGKQPVIVTSGAVVDGRNTLTTGDLIRFKRRLDKMRVPKAGRRLVLTSDHYNDLLATDIKFSNLVLNLNAGTLAPHIYGFDIYQYDANPFYKKEGGTTWTKRPYGTVPTNGDHEASVLFVVDNVAKKTGNTKMYTSLASENPDTQANTMAWRHYFIAVPFEAKWMGAIVSGGTEAYTPEITGLNPDTGSVAGATEITVYGIYFTGATEVEVSDKTLNQPGTDFTIVDDSTIRFNIPAGTAQGAKKVKVTGPGGVSNEIDITINA